MRRLVPLVLITAATAAPLVALPASAGSAAEARTVLTAPDYATERHGDPWDMSNAEDTWLGTPVGVTGLRYAAGVLSFRTTSRTPVLDLIPMKPGSLATQRDGRAHPLDTRRYSRVSLRLYSPVRTTGVLNHTTCASYADRACTGQTYFPVYAGWRVYDLAPAWRGARVVGLQLLPASLSGLDLQLDWVRAYRPGSEGASLPPGTHGDLTVLPAYRPRVLDPDDRGGVDYATAVRRDPWDFSAASDLGTRFNMTGVAVSGGVLRARNAGPRPEDNGFLLPMRGAFSGDRYYRLSFRTRYDGPFGLEDRPGAGMVMRMHWYTRAGGRALQSLEDVVMYPGWQTVTYDLRQGGPAVTDPTQADRRIGWRGQTITWLRWDHNEDRGARTWYVDDVRIAADDSGRGGFLVSYRDPAATPDARATIALSTRADGAGARTVATGLRVSTVRSSYGLRAAPGLYWVVLTVTGRHGTATTVSSGPVRITT